MLSLLFGKQQKLASSGISLKAVTYFEYNKMEKRYWMDKHLLDQIKSKVLPIAEVLYPGYELLFMFDNATSHAIYIKDALQVAHINKSPRSQHSFLQADWYKNIDREIITQKMYTLVKNPTNGQSQKIQKRVQAILDEQRL